MKPEQDKPPILKTWNNVYLLVTAVLVVLIIFFYLFTRYFE
jgi:hypothetical protein